MLGRGTERGFFQCVTCYLGAVEPGFLCFTANWTAMIEREIRLARSGMQIGPTPRAAQCYGAVVEGLLRRLYPNVGETQGGLFSALRYAVAKAYAVDHFLLQEFTDMVLRSIIDDGIGQMEVREVADVESLIAWM